MPGAGNPKLSAGMTCQCGHYHNSHSRLRHCCRLTWVSGPSAQWGAKRIGYVSSHQHMPRRTPAWPPSYNCATNPSRTPVRPRTAARAAAAPPGYGLDTVAGQGDRPARRPHRVRAAVSLPGLRPHRERGARWTPWAARSAAGPSGRAVLPGAEPPGGGGCPGFGNVDHVSVWRDLQEQGARMQAWGPGGKVRVAMLESLDPNRRPKAPGGGGDGRGGRRHPAAGGLRRRLRLAGLAEAARGLGRGGGRDGRRLGLRSGSARAGPPAVHGPHAADLCPKLPEEVRERYAPWLKRCAAAAGAAGRGGGNPDGLAGGGGRPGGAGAQGVAEPGAALPGALEPDADPLPSPGRAGHHQPPGRPLRTKPRVRRARGFPTLARKRNFLHAVTQVCA